MYGGPCTTEHFLRGGSHAYGDAGFEMSFPGQGKRKFGLHIMPNLGEHGKPFNTSVLDRSY